MISRSGAALAIVIAAAAQSKPLGAECLPTLQLELLPSTSVAKVGDPVAVTVTLRNPLHQGSVPSLCALVPTLLLEAEPHSGAYPVVLFEIVAPNGDVLRPTKPTFSIPVRPSLEKYSYLAPGDFFGATVALDDPPLSFDMRQPGLYRVTAKLMTSARAFVDAELKRTKRSQWVSIKPQDVFQGELRSNAVEIEVR